jgi:hypothetical protein
MGVFEAVVSDGLITDSSHQFSERGGTNMFDSLDETMKHDDASESTPSERLFKYAAVAVVSVLVFGGIFMAIQMME